jgi:beta-alanine degradation protein BauB
MRWIGVDQRVITNGNGGHVKATSTVQVQNDRVLVTEWRFLPGAETGDHVHAHDYVVVPLTSGTLRLQEPTGVREVQLEAGASYARPAGVTHNVINANPFEFRFVEIELIQRHLR